MSTSIWGILMCSIHRVNEIYIKNSVAQFQMFNYAIFMTDGIQYLYCCNVMNIIFRALHDIDGKNGRQA